MTIDGVALVTSYFETVGTGDLQVFDMMFAPDYVNHWSDGREDYGPDGMKQLIQRLRELIAELRVDVHDLIADGDKVAARITVRGTWVATGAPMAMMEIQIYRVDGGMIAERWFAADRSAWPG